MRNSPSFSFVLDQEGFDGETTATDISVLTVESKERHFPIKTLEFFQSCQCLKQTFYRSKDKLPPMGLNLMVTGF